MSPSAPPAAQPVRPVPAVPGTVRSVRFRRPGDPSVLRVETVPAPPAPTGTQLLVRVRASSVNGTDLVMRRGAVPLSSLRRGARSLGFDLVGEVVACGPAVTAFVPGDRVMALLGHAGGAQADLALVPQQSAARVPDAVTDEQAAALPLAGLTALQALRSRARLPYAVRKRVLVIGAAGGIGSYAVQLAALLGAHVTAVASGERLAYVRDLGADEVVDRHRSDVLRSGERWDVVLDAPAVLSFRDARPVLTPDGVLVSTLPISLDALRTLVPARLHRGPRCTFVATSPSSADLALLGRLVETGRLRAPVDRVFPVEQVVEAHRHAESSAVRGKVVVTFDD